MRSSPEHAAAPGGEPGAGAIADDDTSMVNDGSDVFDNLLDAGLHLIELGLPILPVGSGKDPKGVIKWRKDGRDYVTDRMTADEWRPWATKYNVHGIAVLGSNVYGTSIPDIEKPGVDEPMILAARQMLPATCQVDTFSGGWHAYCVIDGEHPGGRVKLAQHPPLEGKTDPVLLAERRGHGSYAVIVGPGRPPLRRDFAPAQLTREQYDQIEAMIRQAGTYTPKAPPVQPYNRTGKGGGTGDIISEALAQGSLSPLAVLPDEWEIVGHDQDGRTFIKRPGATSETSGNILQGVVAIHSSAVDWAPTPPEDKTAQPISGAECLARARFDGDFYAAMRWVENAASAVAIDGEPPPEHWPADLLEAVHDLNTLGATSDRHDPDQAPMLLDEARAVFRKWLGDTYDTDAMDAALATIAVERLDGDPVWLLLISGSGNAKTETVVACGVGAVAVSTVSGEAALLSASPKRSRAKDATGGLLRQLEPRGVLVVKDVTSILSMDRTARQEVLAALREIHDGHWDRPVGTDGGKTLSWAGRIAMLGAVTTAWDSAHAVIATMGDRFVLLRMDSTVHRAEAGRQAINNTGHEQQMRSELAAAAAGVIAGMAHDVDPITDDEADRIMLAADLVTRARTGVDFDYRGNVIDAHAPEMPTRFAKELTQILRGAVAIGMDRDQALRLAIRCARDSMPPLRMSIIDDLAANPASTPTQVRRRIGKPRATVDRQLQALHMLGVCDLDEIELAGDKTQWQYSLAADVDPTCLTITRNVEESGVCDEKSEGVTAPPARWSDLNKSGTALDDDEGPF